MVFLSTGRDFLWYKKYHDLVLDLTQGADRHRFSPEETWGSSLVQLGSGQPSPQTMLSRLRSERFCNWSHRLTLNWSFLTMVGFSFILPYYNTRTHKRAREKWIIALIDGLTLTAGDSNGLKEIILCKFKSPFGLLIMSWESCYLNVNFNKWLIWSYFCHEWGLNFDLQSSGGLHQRQIREEDILQQGVHDCSDCSFSEYHQHVIMLQYVYNNCLLT